MKTTNAALAICRAAFFIHSIKTVIMHIKKEIPGISNEEKPFQCIIS